MRTGIFVGSFNPFTIGHDSIVTRALPLFDRLVIGVVGDQVHKPDMPSAEERIKAIADLYRDEPRIEVKPYYGLAVDFARAENAHFIVKGVRSVKDFEYEREQADINRQLRTSIFLHFIDNGSRITTLRCRCQPISSSQKSLAYDHLFR